MAWAGLALSQVVPQPGPPIPIACAYNLVKPTLASGQAGWVQCTNDGTLISSGGGGGGGAVTIADGADAAQGTTTDPACAGDATSGCTLLSRVSRVAARLTTLITALGSPFQAGGSIGNTSFGATVASSGFSSGALSVGAGTDGWNVTQGAKADSACSTDTGTCSEIALFKRLLQSVNSAPPLGTTGGWTPLKLAALTNTAVAIKASAGQLAKLYCYNPNATVIYVQTYNVASGSVTVGTTVALQSYGIPATSSGGFALSLVGDQYSTAISAAATTTAGGGTAPGTAVDCDVSYN